MTDNRIYLCHRPTGICIGLGKRVGVTWWDRGDFSNSMQKFFDAAVEGLTEEPSTLSSTEFFRQLDDFVVLKESERGKVWEALPPWPWQKGPIFRVQFLALSGDKVIY